MKKYFLSAILLTCALSFMSYARDVVNISVSRPANAPYLVGMPEVNIDADEFSTVTIKMRSNKSGTAKLFWPTSFDNRINELKSIMFYIDRSNDFREYIFDLRSQNRYWAGFVGQILIYPEGGIDGLEVGSAVAMHRSIISYIKSGWREFWAPGDRMILGSTVNNMRAITIWGRPFNYYLYTIIILTMLISFGYYYNIAGDVKASWRNSGRITILVCIICWAVWQASFLATEYIWLRSDLDKYGLFTSLEYKQKAAVGENLYDFICFIKKELPERADAKLITSDTTGFFITKAAYYLYPILVDTKEPKYLLVYMYNKGMDQALAENKGFRLFKRFDGGAYILWKK